MSDAILVVQIVGAVEGLALLVVAAVAIAHAEPWELSARTVFGGIMGVLCCAAILCTALPLPAGVAILLGPAIIGPALVLWSRQPCAPAAVRCITGWGELR
jgi:hypothetical protein